MTPRSLPEAHRAFLHRSGNVLGADPRIVGVAAGGSYLTDSMDEFSDLDLVVAVEPEHHGSVMAERHRIAGALGLLLAAFTGEHVGEPRLLICLYDRPLLHVDLKFVALPDVGARVEDPAILWERDGRFTRALEGQRAEYPPPDLQWIEDRFWIWVHYAGAKIGRGELFEAIDFLSYLRARVLGPLGLRRAGATPSGVRRVEAFAPELVRDLRRTVATHDARECLRAVRACVDLYRALRADAGGIEVRDAAEKAAMQYLSDVERRHGSAEARR
jgi:hypothetical protein